MSMRSTSPAYTSSELWHDAGRHPTSLGCSNCPEFSRCGGIHVGASVYDCNDMCRCAEVANCDVVCRCRPDHFVARVREIGGFALSNVPRASPLPATGMPLAIPLLDHKYSRNSYFRSPLVALPLYRVVNMATGQLHVESRSELSDRFRVDTNARIVLSGVDRDRYVEGWWNFPNRSELLAGLKNLGIELITSPNFSLLSDVPRTDNLHAMKRIALVWSEIVCAGIPAALHINARTDADYDSWADFIRERSEVAVLSFEFATGCGRSDRIDWHIKKLCELSSKVDRPLRLIVRGGSHRLAMLRASFEAVTMLETDSFAKTHRRQCATLMPDGRLRWKRLATLKGDPLDDLFVHNCGVVRAALEMGRRPVQPGSRPTIAIPIRRRAANRDGKSIQPSLLDHLLPPSEGRAIAFNRDRVVAATKP
jgi:hypothetical protein